MALGWVLSQMLVFAVGRAKFPLEYRYFDILLVGVTINLVSAFWLFQLDGEPAVADNIRDQDRREFPRLAHSSGIPALRRPSSTRSLTPAGSQCWNSTRAFHAAIVLSGPVEGSAR